MVAARTTPPHRGRGPGQAHVRADPHTHSHADALERIEGALARLRVAGGRVTPARKAIVAALYQGDDHHVTAEDVAAALAAEHPHVHLSTVYRALEALEQAGVVTRMDLGAGGAVFHLVDHVHHHLVCRRCGAVTEVDDRELGPLRRHLVQHLGVELDATGQTLSGTCRDCRATHEPPS